ncbi:MAG: VOC family protein [Roseovarius sp.]|uniref:VOC family protein n=1 Tax=Roseovarius sp. TaxID=1486281 RepID=UPI001B6DEC17|nr:VOC family protein [Roseovarius sp.]MBQ0751449.1 VOC family protein [Roseovarius sp.]MBQ0809554.1 VOC family protein [Roseovarius sp.]
MAHVPVFALPLLLASTLALSAETIPPALETSAMPVRDLYPLITTPALFEARDFYREHFGFEVAFQASWFVYLTGGADGESRGTTIAFMHPDHPSTPPGPEVFDGRGMIVTIEVSDAAATHARLSDAGAPIVYPLTDEPWGQRRFMTRDPAGVQVDVVQQIAPEAGFWDRYMID